MSDVYIAGVGMTPFGRFRGVLPEQLALQAARQAMVDAGVEKEDIEEVFCGSSYSGPLMGQRVLRSVAMTGGPITNVENACSSSATALREAVSAIRSGRASTILAIGVDSLTQFGGGPIPLEKSDNDVLQGMVMPAVYAMRAQRYLADSGASASDLADVAVKARRNGVDNPYAQLRKAVTAEDVLNARMVADPLTLFMSCPTGDGASAVVVTNSAAVAKRHGVAVRIAASVLQSGAYVTGAKDISKSDLTIRTSRLAYEAAGIGPDDLELIELHDAFAIAELMYYEALGLCEYGEAPKLLKSGVTSRAGRVPVNPGGGLLSRGHPVGATGLAQVAEAVWQMRGEAGARQVARQPRVAITHCTGGGIAGLDHGACAIHVLAA